VLTPTGKGEITGKFKTEQQLRAELKDMKGLWNEDSIEIFIFPEGTDNYYQFVVNTIGSSWKGSRTGERRIPGKLVANLS